jgi:ethanolamine transporter EutH
LISDEKLALVRVLSLPTMEWRGDRLVKRVTLAVSEREDHTYLAPGILDG